MKISKSKQELARIISENGGWCDGAEWAAQCKSDVTVSFYSGCAPYRDGDCWWGDHLYGTEIKILKLMPNWHQTILSRDEYFHLYPVPDAKPEFCESVMRSIPEPSIDTGCVKIDMHGDSTITIGGDPMTAMRRMQDSLVFDTTPTIEQLAADYRNAKDYAERKQQEADDAKADAEAKLAELVAAGKAHGMVISVDEKEPELVITDWRDLRVGDEVKAVIPNGGRVTSGEIGVITKISANGFRSDFPSQGSYHYYDRHFDGGDVIFIRRP